MVEKGENWYEIIFYIFIDCIWVFEDVGRLLMLFYINI